MFKFLGRGFIEQFADLNIPVIFGLVGKKIIPSSGLGLCGKRGVQVHRSPAFPEFSHENTFYPCGSFLFLDNDGFSTAFGSSLADLVLEMIRNGINPNSGFQLIFIIFEHFRTQFIAVSVTHTLISNDHFHIFLLIK
jgi:hypothetical protein